MKILDGIIHKLSQGQEKKTVAIAGSQNWEIIETIKLASQQNIAQFLLYGNKEETEQMMAEAGGKMNVIGVIDSKNPAEDAAKAVAASKAQVLMKGMLPTSTVMRACLAELRTGKHTLLSQVAAFEMDSYHKTLFLTDAAMCIAPDLNEKLQITANGVLAIQRLGISKPKVAVLCAVETVSHKMPHTLDAAVITQAGNRGQIPNCIIDGPLAYDNAISAEAAAHKGISSPVAGDVDLLVCPSLESANILYKAFSFNAKARLASIIVGASAPVVVTSRSDSAQTKLSSIALAIYHSMHHHH